MSSDQTFSFQTFPQGKDGSARKPALIQDTGYMVEKTSHNIATY